MSTDDQSRKAFIAQAQAIFEQALDLPAEQRPDFLDKTCAEDEALCRFVKRLLVADQYLADHPLLPPPHIMVNLLLEEKSEKRSAVRSIIMMVRRNATPISLAALIGALICIAVVAVRWAV